ncbi:MAG TPA: ComF family protein [Micromonosporaceae bacterium]|nr:ComF family protein [Micromonosporaceae bacterium]
MRELADLGGALADLVLPATCAGCATAGRGGVCPACATRLGAAVPHRTSPLPAPPGFPPCVTVASYDGVLRELLLGFKERGRHDLARPLGALLAAAVAAGAVAAGAPPGRELLLVPVPATAAAARRRYGDHALRLARQAARSLRAGGRRASVATALRARPRADSAGLDSGARARVAAQAFQVRPPRVARLRRAVRGGALVVLVDDIVTTGSTLAAAASRLAEADVPTGYAAVLAATRRRFGGPANAVKHSLL